MIIKSCVTGIASEVKQQCVSDRSKHKNQKEAHMYNMFIAKL